MARQKRPGDAGHGGRATEPPNWETFRDGQNRGRCGSDRLWFKETAKVLVKVGGAAAEGSTARPYRRLPANPVAHTGERSAGVRRSLIYAGTLPM